MGLLVFTPETVKADVGDLLIFDFKAKVCATDEQMRSQTGFLDHLGTGGSLLSLPIFLVTSARHIQAHSVTREWTHFALSIWTTRQSP